MPSILKLDFSHTFTLQNSIWSCMSPQGTQQWLHTVFFQSKGVSAVRGLLTLPGKRRLPGTPSVPVAQLFLSLSSGAGSKKTPFSDRVLALPKLCTATATLLPALGSATQLHRVWGPPQCRATIHPLMDIPFCGFSPHHPCHQPTYSLPCLFP